MVNKKLIVELKSILKDNQLLIKDQILNRFSHIWKTDQPLQAIAVTFPETTKEVSDIIKICNKNNQEIIVHGGLTNLVGGTETKKNQLVISLEKMNKIEEVDDKSRTITTQAGVILETLINAAAEKNLLLPLNFGARGSAQIGGAVSSNAGGLRVFRFGMTRQMVLGIEVVLPDGTIISSLKKIIKDNSGYDLKQLFIGSEGTLGIVTKVVLRLQEAPKSRCSAIVGVNSYELVVDLLKFLESELGGNLSGFELIWKSTYNAMTESSELIKPLSNNYEYYVFIESLGSQPKQDYDLLENRIEESLKRGLIIDAVMANSDKELKQIWQIREDISILASKAKFDQHFDISLPIPKIGEIIDSITKELNKLNEVKTIFPFGHIADGNIHFIIGRDKNTPKLIDLINSIVYAPLKKFKGSLSAEHGIGLDKKAYLYTTRSKEEIKLMEQLKKLFDPKNILNPGRIIF
ncbi:MAG: FAD-binding oxidoreductase [Flavobacteriaceae bacterium]|nr:FAD-binding oxidoreductase [Flavobacteriaceae bacterium]|tara:strand:+ start:8376 stop:9764 length:1389 start_codon:yes stop_codon:yes gene_type:complete